MTFMQEQHSTPAYIPAFYVYKMCNGENHLCTKQLLNTYHSITKQIMI